MPGFFYRYLFISVLTKASRTISKIVAKIKEAGICICNYHCAAKVSEKTKLTNLFFYKKLNAYKMTNVFKRNAIYISVAAAQ